MTKRNQRQDLALHIDTNLSVETLRSQLEKWQPWQFEVAFSNGLRTSDLQTREPFNTGPLWKFSVLAARLPMDKLRGKAALDVGFAAGHNSIHLAQEYGMSVTAIDVFDKWFDMARFLASMAKVDRIDFVKASADRYQKPEAFDLILHFGTLYHLPNPLLSLECAYTSLRADGYLGLETTCYTGTDPNQLKFMYGIFGDKTNYFAFSKPTLELLLSIYGFTNIELLNETPMVKTAGSEGLSRTIYLAQKGSQIDPMLRPALIGNDP
jgi:2-polyprenyl-3-methyl-5-hydroxy-6-metoxy-1,4-benzoquinol methylase